MSAPASTHGRAHWPAVAALVILLAGVGVAIWQSRPAGVTIVPPRSTSTAPGSEPGGDVVGQALQQSRSVQGTQTPIDSVAFKRRWLDEVRGIDVAGLDPAKLELFLRFANAEHCTCGCGYTLAGCRASDMTCEVSGARLGALLDSVRAGRITRARGIRSRPHGGG
jgi:hypothetical protein